MIYTTKDISDFFCLLRLGMFGRDENICYKKNVSLNWDKIFQLSKEQAVVGLIFDAIEKLSPDFKPSQKLLLNWFGLVVLIEKSNNKFEKTLLSLYNLLYSNDVQFLLLKGQSCAVLYSNPKRRQTGDIDILVKRVDYERVKQIFINVGYIPKDESRKDFHIDFDNIMVECHKTPAFFYNPILNYKLQKIIHDEAFRVLGKIEIENKSINTLNYTFNTFYLFIHLYHHFLQVGVGIRQLCDWVLWIQNYQTKINWSKIEKWLKDVHAKKAFIVFFCLCEKKIGLEVYNKPDWITCHNPIEIDEVLADIISVGNFGKFGDSMKTRKYGKNFISNICSYGFHLRRVIRISKYGMCESFAYPFYKILALIRIVKE